MKKFTLIAAVVISAVVIALGTMLGSTFLPLNGFDERFKAIVLNLRLPRVTLAFLTGGALSISGMVFQSVLQNPLASPFIIGVSSGASLGAGLVMLTGFTIPFIGMFTLPASGFAFALLTIFVVLKVSSKLDKNLSNNTVILFGMVLSLFVNAILTTLAALYREELKNLMYWQMGSFSLKGWPYSLTLLPFLLIGTAGVFFLARELDLLTFGEEEAAAMGVDSKRTRIILLALSSVLTGAAVSLSGAIGFVDLIAPHLARRIAGSRHRDALPIAFLSGGSLLVVTDLVARTAASPSELPVGTVTALIGAPFFAYVYFKKR